MYIEQTAFLINQGWPGGGYYTNLSVGTPPQIITALLDTSYGATIIPSINYTTCTSTFSSCSSGAFNASLSSTVSTTAVDGYNETWSAGNIVSDVVQIGSVSIAGMQFGLSTSGENVTGYATGELGIGYSANNQDFVNAPDRSFLGQLVSAGVTDSKLFSTFLGGTGNDTGSIVFGGVDLSRYRGELVTLDALTLPFTFAANSTTDATFQHAVAITDISLTASNQTTYTILENGDPDGGQDGSSIVGFDTTEAWWHVSPDVYNAIAPLIPGLNTTTAVIPCSQDNDNENDNLTITIRFGAAVSIKVPLPDLIIPIFTDGGAQNLTADGLPLCQFAVVAQTGSRTYINLMGYSVLRSMYTVYDLDNGQISIAQSNLDYSSEDPDIHAVPAGTDGLSRVLASASKSLVTAAPNSGVDASLVSATATSERSLSVWTTSPAVGQVTGDGAVPGAFGTYPASVLGSGTLVSGVTPAATSTGSAASRASTTSSKGGAPQPAAAAVQGSLFLAAVNIVAVLLL